MHLVVLGRMEVHHLCVAQISSVITVLIELLSTFVLVVRGWHGLATHLLVDVHLLPVVVVGRLRSQTRESFYTIAGSEGT